MSGIQRLRKRLTSGLYFLIPIIVLLIIWEVYSRLGGVSSILLSRPSEISIVIAKLFQAQTSSGHSVLLTHILTSLYRLFFALFLATVAGVGLGILMGINRHIYRFFDPLITIIMPIPGIAWAPIFMIWLGFGNPTIITAGTVAAFFPIVYNTTAGIRSIDQKLVWSARSTGANRATIFFRVYIPAAAAYIFTGFKLGLARAWRTIIAVEMLAATLWGLGYMIFDARDYLRPSIIYGGIIILAVIYLLIERVFISWLEKRTIIKWGMIRVSEA